MLQKKHIMALTHILNSDNIYLILHNWEVYQTNKLVKYFINKLYVISLYFIKGI